MNSIAKFLISGVVAVGSLVFADIAMATNYTATGVPFEIDATSQYGSTGGDDSFEINGFKSAGACKVDAQNGNVILMIHRKSEGNDGDRVWTLALAAEEAGKPVTVAISDANQSANGGCYILWVFM